MKEAIGKTVDLRDLLLDLVHLSDAEIEAFGRKYYSDNFLTIAKRGIHLLHDGEEVAFFLERFDHAFFKPIDWRQSKEKQVIERGRIERIPWILPMIQGKVPNSQCWLKSKASGEKRIYVCFKLRYVVWIESRKVGGWRFSSGYNADVPTIREVYLKGAECIWHYNKKCP